MKTQLRFYALKRDSSPQLFALVEFSMNPDKGLIVVIHSSWSQLLQEIPVNAILLGEFYTDESGNDLLAFYKGMAKRYLPQSRGGS